MALWEQKRSQLLGIIERPKVALDATETALPDDAGLLVHDFSIATDEQTRINGTSFAPKLDGPLPAVIFLHGTGGARQDGFGLLRTLAQKGFFALAIDARYHGAVQFLLTPPSSSAANGTALRAGRARSTCSHVRNGCRL